jgi:hypothetical protein
LHEFALAQARLFDVADVSALQNMHGSLAKAIETGRKQAVLTACFGIENSYLAVCKDAAVV